MKKQLLNVSRINLVKDCFIAEGAYGQVFKGQFNNKIVAIKELMFDQTHLTNYSIFKNEIEIIKQLDHENIVEFIGIVDEPKYLDIIMEYVPCGSLNELIKKQTLNKKIRQIICHDLSKAILYLHNKDIIHRDLKSGNVLISTIDPKAKVIAKLCDFDTCCYEKDSTFDKKIGTPIYLPPEQWNSKKMTKESDIYSFSIICYECIDNHIAYDSPEFPNEWNIAIFVCTNKRLPKPKECGDQMWEIITTCWQSEPTKRLSL